MNQNFTISIPKILPLFPTRAYMEFALTSLEKLGLPKITPVFFVERSESPNITDSWALITPTGTTNYYYIDDYINLLSMYRTVFYRVYIVVGATRYTSDVATVVRGLRRDEFLRRRKILYDEEIVLRKFSGIKIAILKRRHTGERCNVCYDPNTRNVTKSNCSVCYGTGFKNPYFEPFITYGARTPETKGVEEQNDGNEKDMSRMQILDYPTVSPQDIVIDLKWNDRYKVMGIEQTEMRREMVHQELSLTKLARTSPEYFYPVDNKLFEIESSILI